MLRRLGTKEKIILWLRTKSPEEVYVWINPNGCACGQFLAKNEDSNWFDEAVIELNQIAKFGEPTFGELLKQVEASWPLAV